MGTQMTTFFAEAAGIGGLRAKIRLAELTQTPTALAGVLPDLPDQHDSFRHALEQVRSEFEEFGEERSTIPPIDARLVDTTPRHPHLEAAEFLVAERNAFISDRRLTAQRITEVGTSTLEIERAGLWFLDPTWTYLKCIDLYERSRGEHSSGAFLLGADFRPYFAAVASEGLLDARNARTDPRTRCLLDAYLAPLGITSILDVPLWSRSDLRGVLCLEHVGQSPRAWSLADLSFAILLTEVVGMHLELDAHWD